MSRIQGDSYKTHTNHELNEYKWRLREKLAKLEKYHEKWYKIGSGWVMCSECDRLINPNGSWKWNGWEVEAHEYHVKVFPEECVEIKNGKPSVIGWALYVVFIDNDREKANQHFKKAQKIAKTLKKWYPSPETAALDKPGFEWEGRIPRATVAFDEKTYSFCLYVDGEYKMSACTHEECENEVQNLGAELVDIHTP